MNEFKVGDRVRAYELHNYYTGKIKEVAPSGLLLVVDIGTSLPRYFHPKQCRRLKPKAKSVRVTRQFVFDACERAFSQFSSMSFNVLCKELGLEDDK